mgnify:CR=1 FL=1|jgi:hydrogenase maturation protease
MTTSPLRRIVVGIGNPERGDDAAGRVVARRLRGRLPEAIEIVELDGEATALLACIDGAAEAFLVDACSSGAPAGTVQRFDVAGTPLSRGTFGLSTHGFGLVEAVELARVLGQLPARCVVYAIEGAAFESGAGLSSAVAASVAEVADRLVAEFGSQRNTRERQDA